MRDVYEQPGYADVKQELHTELARLRQELQVPNPDPAETIIGPKK